MIRSSSTVTLRLQVSGQSKVQTLARSMTAIGDSWYREAQCGEARADDRDCRLAALAAMTIGTDYRADCAFGT
jgi:hypothetical protein